MGGWTAEDWSHCCAVSHQSIDRLAWAGLLGLAADWTRSLRTSDETASADTARRLTSRRQDLWGALND